VQRPGPSSAHPKSALGVVHPLGEPIKNGSGKSDASQGSCAEVDETLFGMRDPAQRDKKAKWMVDEEVRTCNGRDCVKIG